MPKLDAFENELVKYRDILVPRAIKMTRSRDLGEDLVQDTMVMALRYRASFLAGSNMGGWLYTIMRNLHIDRSRRNRVMQTCSESQIEGVPAANNTEIGLEVLDTFAAMAELSPELQRTVMAVAGGRKYDEVAKIERVYVGTIKSRVSRARAALTDITGSKALREKRFSVSAAEAARRLLDMAA